VAVSRDDCDGDDDDDNDDDDDDDDGDDDGDDDDDDDASADDKIAALCTASMSASATGAYTQLTGLKNMSNELNHHHQAYGSAFLQNLKEQPVRREIAHVERHEITGCCSDDGEGSGFEVV
jgi:hypothetical protein